MKPDSVSERFHRPLCTGVGAKVASEQNIAAYVDHHSDYGRWKSVRLVCMGKHSDAVYGSSCHDLMASQAYYSLSTSACVFTTE